MSLSEIGSGLLQTHVTWSDIELDMQDALGTVATFGPNKKVTNIGEENGFASRICLVDPDWQNGTEDLPKKFVVKIISQLDMAEFANKMDNSVPIDLEAFESMSDKMKRMHNVEVEVYDLIKKYCRENIPHTKIYKACRFDDNNTSKGYLIMEFIEELITVHSIDVVEPEALDKILQGLAAFQRISSEMTDDDRAAFPTGFFVEMCTMAFPPKMIEAGCTKLEKFFGDEMVDQMKKVREYIPKVMDAQNLEKLDNLSGLLGMTPVLVHGDLWSTNMLWTKKNGKHEVKAIIDYQTTFIGCAAADLARLFCSLLGGQVRRDNWESLLEKFYEYVKEEMKDNVPYTLEQALEIVLEKAKGLIDDFISEYEKNEKLEKY